MRRGLCPVARLVEACEFDQAFEVAALRLALVGHEDVLARVQVFRDEYEQVFRELVDALPLRPAADRSLFRLFLLGGLNWVHLWYRAGRRTPEQIAAAMVDMLRTGVEGCGERDGSA